MMRSAKVEGESGAVDQAGDFIDEAVGGLDPVESSTVDGMLADGRHPNAIINRIRAMREAA